MTNDVSGFNGARWAWDSVRFLLTIGGLIAIFIQSGRQWGSTDAHLDAAIDAESRIEVIIKEQEKTLRDLRDEQVKHDGQIHDLQNRLDRLENRLNARR